MFRDLTDERALRTLKVLVPHNDGYVPSLGGLLVLGRYPQQFYPSLRATFVVYPTPTVGEPGPRGERFLDERSFEGPIPRMIGPMLDRLKSHMSRRAVVRGAYREEEWQYPETALREALVNALAHRDLSSMARGTPVQIQMFPDRLVIQNPGGLFGPVTIERLGEEGVSSTRNQVVLRLLEDTTLPGEGRAVCENRGSGIGAMLASLRRAGMSSPRFEDRVSVFVVTFPNHTLVDERTLEWLASIGADSLTESQRIALAMMRRGEELTNTVYRQATGVDSRVATRELGELVARGFAIQLGTRRWASYRLSEAPARPEQLPERGPRRRRDWSGDILRLLGQHGELSRAEIARVLGMQDQAARWWLQKLRDEGRVETSTSNPRSPNVRWRLPPGDARSTTA